MAKKLVKKKKLRVFRLLLVILILGVISFLIYLYLDTNIKNIIIKGTTYLNDDYIIELAQLDDYPSFYYTTSHKIKNKLEKSPYIKKAEVKKSIGHIVTINIEENRILFDYAANNKLILENKKEIEKNEFINTQRVPRLMNYVPDKKYEKLIKGILKVDKDILGKVSEITYLPTDYDKDRFLLYMTDGNSVYITLTKLKMINYYNKVLTQLSGKKGILYLDSGNHFQVME